MENKNCRASHVNPDYQHSLAIRHGSFSFFLLFSRVVLIPSLLLVCNHCGMRTPATTIDGIA